MKYIHLDSGAIYRAIALFFKKRNLLEEEEEVQKKALQSFTYYFSGNLDNKRHYLNEEDVTDQIREREIAEISSKLSAKKIVRDFATQLQRLLAEGENIVVEGRDTGSVVFPDAEIKFYLDADPVERAKRRFNEMKILKNSEDLTVEEIEKDLRDRDARDENRELSPLVCPADADKVDTSSLTIHQMVTVLQKKIQSKNPKASKRYIFSYKGKGCSLIYILTKWVFTAYFKIFHKYRVYGLENFKPHSPAIIACNHVSLLDPPMLGCACPEVIHCLAKKALFKTKGMRCWLAGTNTYPVTGSSDDKEVMKKVVTLLLKGNKVLIFPEGTRGKCGNVQPLRKGLALFADKGRASVIPTAVIGPEYALPKNRKVPKLFTTLIVAFGPPIYFSDILEEIGDKKKAREVFLERVQQEIQKLINKYKEQIKEKK